MPRLFTLALGLLPSLAVAQQAAWSGLGFVELGAASCDATPSPARRGDARLACGGGSGEGYAQARYALNYEPNLYWRAQIHGLVRSAQAHEGQKIGLVEAFVQRDWYPSEAGEHRLRLRVGQSFFGNSRENTDALWSAPNTLTLSALNSWIAEEFRPIGAEFSWRNAYREDANVEVGIGALVGNDTSGTLLAWRGFALHQRIAVFDENLATAPLRSLNPAFSGGFPTQRLYKTQPFGADLDGRVGYTARIRLQADARWRWLLHVADNRGDRLLHGDQYAWRTRFFIFGLEYQNEGPLTLAAEWMKGHSQMGVQPQPFVDAGFEAAYALAAWRFNEHWQLALRSERFSIVERDFSSAERNDEHGQAQTLALMYTPSENWRVGLEYLRLEGERPGLALETSLSPKLDSEAVRVEVRRNF